eukprot:CAMPEP_0117676850 /NCGR_PEP_ID=MMETSP0804-20121206/16426_1 /TAXON_ID=1074897 /ORGANISM="Tetraselmis astigmatica, Strain CCMP880" /LENGTH=276 /DNA_ID=CAMNT_0005486083 /DNA_START=90 /DNA_END=920 /DNA_ORIENTATION=+
MSVLDSSVVREHELQAVLRQKDFELDERDRLLQKSKTVIEQLQEELQFTRQELDDAEKRAQVKGKMLSDQQVDARELKDRAAALQLELECKESEHSAVQEALTVRLAELERIKAEFREFRERSGAEQRHLAEAIQRTREDVVVLTQRLEAAERAKEEARKEVESWRLKATAFEITLKERDAAVKASKEKSFMLQGEVDTLKGHLEEEQAHTSRLESEGGNIRGQLEVDRNLAHLLACICPLRGLQHSPGHLATALCLPCVLSANQRAAPSHHHHPR